MEGCGVLGTVGYHFMLLIMFTNHVMSRAAEARHTLRTLAVANSYGMAAQSASQTIHPCLRMAFSPVEVSSFGCWDGIQRSSDNVSFDPCSVHGITFRWV